jgi:glyoxylase-like metal-dependent hydrolase (beta-lactamase superfamily II)
MYVIVGRARALVIDSGSGFCDFKAIISRLTGLPYDVAITHGHPDHAGGIGQFDAVYMDPADVEMARGISYRQRVEYGRIMRHMTADKLGLPPWFENVWNYTDADVRQWDKLPEFRPLHDGQVFDLGGRKVTAYHIGNHTPGSTIFLDDRSRILFTGDVANPNVGAIDPVSSVLRGLLRIRNMRSKYDRIYTGHTAYAGTVDAVSQSPLVLDDVIEAFRAVLRGDAVVKTTHSHLFPERSLTVSTHGRASVAFDPQKLWLPDEPHVVP